MFQLSTFKEIKGVGGLKEKENCDYSVDPFSLVFGSVLITTCTIIQHTPSYIKKKNSICLILIPKLKSCQMFVRSDSILKVPYNENKAPLSVF